MFVDILINLYIGAQMEVCELILTQFCSQNKSFFKKK